MLLEILIHIASHFNPFCGQANGMMTMNRDDSCSLQQIPGTSLFVGFVLLRGIFPKNMAISSLFFEPLHKASE
jgi:hypothetical protein